MSIDCICIYKIYNLSNGYSELDVYWRIQVAHWSYVRVIILEQVVDKIWKIRRFGKSCNKENWLSKYNLIYHFLVTINIISHACINTHLSLIRVHISCKNMVIHWIWRIIRQVQYICVIWKCIAFMHLTLVRVYHTIITLY